VVVDAEGRPLAGVVVTATPQRDTGPVLEVVGTARTDDAGRFRMPGTDDGVHRLHADPPRGHLAQDVLARGGDAAVRLALDATAAATLHVLDGAGRPVEGATLLVRPIGGEPDPFGDNVAARGQSDASGHARLEGLDGAKSWQLEVHPPHGRADVFARTVSPWTVADGSVRLERTWTIKGRIVDLAGTPIGGASVTGGGASAQAESDGRFVLGPLQAGAVRIQTHLDWVHGPEVAAQAGDDVGDLRLDRGVPVRVRVEDWPGPPAGRSDVAVRLTGRRPDGQGYGDHQTRTTDGTFTMSGVPRDGRYRVYIGPWPDGRYALGEGLEGRDQPHLLQLVPGLEVRGRLLGSASDLQRIQVELLDDTGPFLHVEPRDDGSFRVVGVPPGTYEILVMPEGQKSLRVHVEAGASPVDIPLPARR
jgi:hypothetical protein